MARDLVLDVITKAHDEGLRSAKRDLHDLGGEIPNVTARTEELGRANTHLEAALAKARSEQKRLEDQLRSTGDVTLLRSIGRQRGLATKLEQVIKDLEPAAEQGGIQVGSSIFGGIASSFEGMPIGPVLISVLVGSAVAAAPAVGAAVGAAVVGAAGLGGIVGGILAAHNDPGVQSAWTAFIDGLGREFTGAGVSFVQPIEQALRVLQTGIAGIDFAGLFRDIAPEVTMLARGLSGFVTQFSGGFISALEHARPVMDELARDLPGFGKAIGDAINIIAQSPDAVTGMRTLFTIVDGLLIDAGALLRFFTDAWGGMLDLIIGTGLALEPYIGWIPGLGNMLHRSTDAALALKANMDNTAGSLPPIGDAFNIAANAAGGFGTGVTGAAQAAQAATGTFLTMAKAEGDMLGNLLNLRQETIRFKQDQADLADAIKKNGTSLDINTQAGRDNMTALDGWLLDAQRMRDLLLSVPTTAATANNAYDSMILQIEKFALALGISRQQVELLIGALGNLPRQLHVGVDYVAQGESHAGNVAHRGPSPTVNRARRPGAFAAGGTLGPYETGVAGDPGPFWELVTAGSGGARITNHRTSAGSGGTSTRVVLDFANVGTDPLLNALVEVLRKAVNGAGGPDVFFESRR